MFFISTIYYNNGPKIVIVFSRFDAKFLAMGMFLKSSPNKVINKVINKLRFSQCKYTEGMKIIT
jgi:hypothetical protein